jgi:hypothetical protein
MADQPETEDRDERVQINVTMTRRTLEDLRALFPVALDDSERVRRAVSESIERHRASEYSIRRPPD